MYCGSWSPRAKRVRARSTAHEDPADRDRSGYVGLVRQRPSLGTPLPTRVPARTPRLLPASARSSPASTAAASGRRSPRATFCGRRSSLGRGMSRPPHRCQRHYVAADPRVSPYAIRVIVGVLLTSLPHERHPGPGVHHEFSPPCGRLRGVGLEQLHLRLRPYVSRDALADAVNALILDAASQGVTDWLISVSSWFDI